MTEAYIFDAARTPRGKGQLREGLRYVAGRPDLIWPIVLVGFIGTFGFNYQVTIALMAREQFGLGAEAFGLLSTTFAVGSLTGALLSRLASTSRSRSLSSPRSSCSSRSTSRRR